MVRFFMCAVLVTLGLAKYLGAAFENAPPELLPTVGLSSPGEQVVANFGELPFVFDFNFSRTSAAPIGNLPVYVHG